MSNVNTLFTLIINTLGLMQANTHYYKTDHHWNIY